MVTDSLVNMVPHQISLSLLGNQTNVQLVILHWGRVLTLYSEACQWKWLDDTFSLTPFTHHWRVPSLRCFSVGIVSVGRNGPRLDHSVW